MSSATSSSIRFALLLSILSCFTVSTWAECTRKKLQAVADSFFDTAFTGSYGPQFIMGQGMKVSQNTFPLKNLHQSAYKNSTGYASQWQINALDTEACQLATFRMVDQGGKDNASTPQTAMMSVRIKIGEPDGAIKEVEIVNALNGTAGLFAPEKLLTQAPDMWTADQQTNYIPMTRDELIRTANTYPEGIQTGSDTVISYPECPRIENGVQTTASCGSGLAKFKCPVVNRRWVVDKQTGVVMGSFFFDFIGAAAERNVSTAGLEGITALELNEYFKVRAGKIAGIQAVMRNVYGPWKDVWSLEAINSTISWGS